MHWAGSLFLLFCLLFAMMWVLLWCVPLTISFNVRYQRNWHGEVLVSWLWMQRRIPLAAERVQTKKSEKKQTGPWLTDGLHRWMPDTSFQIEWKPMVSFAAEAMRIITRRCRLNHLELRCIAGFSRPDITAYSYGLFWGLWSLLPETWHAKSRICVEPDFQNARLEFETTGIIDSSAGQAIGIIISLAALWLRGVKAQKAAVNIQNREEQIAYES